MKSDSAKANVTVENMIEQCSMPCPFAEIIVDHETHRCLSGVVRIGVLIDCEHRKVCKMRKDDL